MAQRPSPEGQTLMERASKRIEQASAPRRLYAVKVTRRAWIETEQAGIANVLAATPEQAREVVAAHIPNEYPDRVVWSPALDNAEDDEISSAGHTIGDVQVATEIPTGATLIVLEGNQMFRV
jgi:hypothetical protein